MPITITNKHQARMTVHKEGVTFHCHDCKQDLPVQTSGGTGYGYDREDNTVCYACCGIRDEEDMKKYGKALLYLTVTPPKEGVRHGFGTGGKVSNWPGTLSFNVGVRVGRHNIAGKRYDVWFAFDGNMWHGVTYGDNTQICHCKRTKEVAK